MDKYSFNNVSSFMSSKYANMFPYKRIYYSDADMHKMFKNLQNIDFSDRMSSDYWNIHNVNIPSRHLLFMNRPLILISKQSDYGDFQVLSDMFQEESRMKCKFCSAVSSPAVYFEKNAQALATKIISRSENITPFIMRDELYLSVKECSSFKPSNLTFIIQLFGARSVLDPCSGWGDRLIACMSAGIRYVGVDPNSDLHKNYQDMIEFFMKPRNRKKYTMIEDTIQEAKLPNEKFDLVFTSPPYFKIEQYNNRGLISDSDETEWFNNFMIPMIDKTAAKLKTGGHIVLVINQMPREKYIQRMLDYVYSKPNFHYLGVIGYADRLLRNPQPMWVWQKQKKIPEDLYNPPMIITSHEFNIGSRLLKFQVFRDDELIGGTKQRAMIPMFEKIKKSVFIYAGPPQGYAQIALSFAAKLTHKKAVLFLNKLPRPTDLTNFAMGFNSDGNRDIVTLYEVSGDLKKAQECAKTYNDETPDSYLLSFGGNEKPFINALTKSLHKAIPVDINPKRIWLVAGSATILNVLYIIFPDTEFHVVQVGKKIWDDQLDLTRTTLYISDEKFSDVAREQPPYPSVKTYDAKLWKYFKQHGKNGDFIWNVGK